MAGKKAQESTPRSEEPGEGYMRKTKHPITRDQETAQVTSEMHMPFTSLNYIPDRILLRDVYNVFGYLPFSHIERHLK